MIDPSDGPFLLLDDARQTGAVPARLYRRPSRVLTAMHRDELSALFGDLRIAEREGQHAAGFLAYEAGHGFENTGCRRPASGDQPLAWFGIFDDYETISAADVTALLPPPQGAFIAPLRYNISAQDYAASFARVQEYIQAGDIYQANLTFRAAAQYAGHPLALYAAIRPSAKAGYGGILWTGEQWLLSFSPELFFAVKDGRVTTKPMKGTAIRHTDPVRDDALAAALQSDPKQRAENLMIVDLLRNDLSRICAAGSVEVPQLFHIESYPTVHQMTSTIAGQLQAGRDSIDLIQAIFPCGSITGAPKIRAMQIIDEVETGTRGIYCGSIGRIDPGGDAAFNVAIRTFSLDETAKTLVLGIGSAVVADSVIQDEWAECLAKGKFAKMPGYGCDLVETMRFEPAEGLLRLEMHLERMKESARALAFEFDRHAARNQLHAVTFHLEKPSKIRLKLSSSGAMAIETRAMPPLADGPWNIAIMPLAVDREDYRLRHKTSDRDFYDDARKLAQKAGDIHEVLFTDPDGFLTEGSITALFVERGGNLLTPPLSRGLLPSILRRALLESGRAMEQDLRSEDLADGFFVGNSLRGLIPAQLAND